MRKPSAGNAGNFRRPGQPPGPRAPALCCWAPAEPRTLPTVLLRLSEDTRPAVPWCQAPRARPQAVHTCHRDLERTLFRPRLTRYWLYQRHSLTAPLSTLTLSSRGPLGSGCISPHRKPLPGEAVTPPGLAAAGQLRTEGERL